MILAMVPLAMLNALPLAAGCICADGHYEPVCHAGAMPDWHVGLRLPLLCTPQLL